MSFMDRIEDKMSNAYVDAKLDPTDKPQAPEHHAEEHASGEHYHGGSRLSDAFISLSNAIHGDTHHKTGEAFNEDDDDDKMRKMSSDGKEW
ncbi:hypothetical protein CRE_09419 [Caenorhabditis remanei]|nr:hypothetical protein CRE_09419 [Caenorhabditis remanei]